jgi:hypothetical protein
LVEKIWHADCITLCRIESKLKNLYNSINSVKAGKQNAGHEATRFAFFLSKAYQGHLKKYFKICNLLKLLRRKAPDWGLVIISNN